MSHPIPAPRHYISSTTNKCHFEIMFSNAITYDKRALTSFPISAVVLVFIETGRRQAGFVSACGGTEETSAAIGHRVRVGKSRTGTERDSRAGSSTYAPSRCDLLVETCRVTRGGFRPHPHRMRACIFVHKSFDTPCMQGEHSHWQQQVPLACICVCTSSVDGPLLQARFAVNFV